MKTQLGILALKIKQPDEKLTVQAQYQDEEDKGNNQ